jgi:nucleotide-binding universal stress UspA family protein
MGDTSTRILVPYDDMPRACAALDEACRIALPGDEVIVVAAIIVPGDLPLDAAAGDVWKHVCRAERYLQHAREQTHRYDAAIVFVRVQARKRSDAVIAVATEQRADLIMLAGQPGVRGWIDDVRIGLYAILHRAPCPVWLVYPNASPCHQGRNGAWPLLASADARSPTLVAFKPAHPRTRLLN